MRIQWSHIVIPISIGISAGFATEANLWLGLSQPLVGVVTLIAAAILVRLARGIPFTAIEVLETGEANKLSAALKSSVRSLRTLLIVCFLSALALIFGELIQDIEDWATGLISSPITNAPTRRNSTFDLTSVLLCTLLSYVFVRTYAVIQGDVEIADIQADILLKKRGKTLADDFEKNVVGPSKGNFKQPENYGGRLPGE